MADEKVQEPLVQLKDLRAARNPPHVRLWWDWTCWVVFFLGLLSVLLAMTAMAAPGLIPVAYLRWPLLGTLYAAFLCGAINTFLAAKMFRGREGAIHLWVRHRIQYLDQVSKEGEPQSEDKSSEAGEICIRRFSKPEQQNLPDYKLYISGEFQPEPFRLVGEGFVRVLLKEYLELIASEVRGAKRAAAGLAAALGGLFITAVQIYNRLFPSG